ncbi:MAG: methyltransferase [Candidatus Lokiarchaeota archaeon]|nr:methyltransferase [Candidatus Lokiarchaeota archaeon]
MNEINKIPDPIIECDINNVYYPSEDSYLIIDYFKKNITSTHIDGLEHGKIKLILDMGTGSGLLAIFFQILKNIYADFNPKIFASDILREAIENAKINEKTNKKIYSFRDDIIFLHSNLFDSFPSKLLNSFDIIVFNPPYLPSIKEKKRNIFNKKIDHSWDGGKNGLRIIEEFLTKAKIYIKREKKNSCIYLTTSSLANLDNLETTIEENNYEFSILDKVHYFFEDILLFRLHLQ